jgi:hypothetical protein
MTLLQIGSIAIGKTSVVYRVADQAADAGRLFLIARIEAGEVAGQRGERRAGHVPEDRGRHTEPGWDRQSATFQADEIRRLSANGVQRKIGRVGADDPIQIHKSPRAVVVMGAASYNKVAID